MHYRDLREWLRGVDAFGELRVVEGADWNQEIGAVAELAAQSTPPPAVLFDKIKDYPAGRRVLTGIHNPTLKRQCLTNHLPLDYSRVLCSHRVTTEVSTDHRNTKSTQEQFIPTTKVVLRSGSGTLGRGEPCTLGDSCQRGSSG